MKNVLITLGCSFTQGDGCWDLDILNQTEFEGKSYTQLSDKQHSLFFQKNQDRFLNYGWPSKLQEMLGYDELYNLGFGGASISHSIKILLDELYYKDFSDCNVLLINLMSFPDRISFFKEGSIQTFKVGHKLHNEYVKEINIGEDLFGNDDDTTLEAYFYIKILKELCNNKGWDFLFASARGNEINHMNLYRDKELIIDNFISIENLLSYPSEHTAVCGHPNEEGHLEIAKKMFKWIVENKKEIKIGNSIEFKKQRILSKLFK